jgi:hypothetical protein
MNGVIIEKVKLNTALLEQVRDKIAAEPENFDMADFFAVVVEYGEVKCKTVCCIGGWALFLSGHTTPVTGSCAFAAATAVLGLTFAQADALFFVWSWPQPFKDDYTALCNNPFPVNKFQDLSWTPLKGNEQKAADVAVARINHFLAHKRPNLPEI